MIPRNYSLFLSVFGAPIFNMPFSADNLECAEQFPCTPGLLAYRRATDQERCDFKLESDFIVEYTCAETLVKDVLNGPGDDGNTWICEMAQDCIQSAFEEYMYNDTENRFEIVFAARFDTSNNFLSVSGDGTLDNPFILTP